MVPEDNRGDRRVEAVTTVRAFATSTSPPAPGFWQSPAEGGENVMSDRSATRHPRRIAVVLRHLVMALPPALLLSACSPSAGPPPPAYTSSCMPCHGDGLGGAPRTGDRNAWEARLAKGVEKVRRNAIEGLEGSTGVMPPKGGRIDLSDQEIAALVDYMIAASR
jgi:cytochrome c5